MENFNKNNLFDSLYETQPKAMKLFCDWIDEYKKECEWLDIFAIGVKFHDIPIEMQLGILLRFFSEMTKKYQSEIYNEDEDSIEVILNEAKSTFIFCMENLNSSL